MKLVWSSTIIPEYSNGHRVDRRAAPKITNKNPYAASLGTPSPDGRCMARVQSALGDMMMTNKGLKNGNRRHTSMPHLSAAAAAASSSTFGFMDLSGYALHQRLRTAPGAEMYVTGMRARVIAAPRDAAAAESSSQGVAGDASGNGDGSWARVDGCRYDPLGNTLEARMRFGRTLMVSGSVRLLYGGGNRIGGAGVLPGETGCDMTLRLRPRAGLGFTAVPLTMPEKSPPNRLTATPTMTIRTTATFIDPEPMENDPGAAYVSVHSYNCVGAAAGLPGNSNNYHREQPSASSDRFEQFVSSGDNGGGDGNGGSDELLSGGGSSGEGAAGADIEIDLNDDEGGDDDGGGGGSAESTEFGDKHNSRWRRPLKSSLSSSSVEATPPNNLFTPAGFVSPSLHPAPNPEPRLRRIQYQTKKPTQHPLLTVAAAVNNHHQPTQDQLLVEMEDVFVKGVRSLLAKHMERSLKHILKDSLMANMGYTVSYG